MSDDPERRGDQALLLALAVVGLLVVIGLLSAWALDVI